MFNWCHTAKKASKNFKSFLTHWKQKRRGIKQGLVWHKFTIVEHPGRAAMTYLPDYAQHIRKSIYTHARSKLGK